MIGFITKLSYRLQVWGQLEHNHRLIAIPIASANSDCRACGRGPEAEDEQGDGGESYRGQHADGGFHGFCLEAIKPPVKSVCAQLPVLKETVATPGTRKQPLPRLSVKQNLSSEAQWRGCGSQGRWEPWEYLFSAYRL